MKTSEFRKIHGLNFAIICKQDSLQKTWLSNLFSLITIVFEFKFILLFLMTEKNMPVFCIWKLYIIQYWKWIWKYGFIIFFIAYILKKKNKKPTNKIYYSVSLSFSVPFSLSNLSLSRFFCLVQDFVWCIAEYRIDR